MGRYVLRRLVQSVPLLLGISVIVFAILKAVPGGPLALYESTPGITDEDIRRLEHSFGLDQPLPVQYVTWLGKFVTGDWGYSLVQHQPVLSLILERLPNTLYLMGTVFVAVLILAIPIGTITAVRQYSLLDHAVTGATFAFLSTPTFWLGLLLIIVFGLDLRWLPLGGMATAGLPFDLGDRIRHLILPATTIALVQLGARVRYLRASMLETIGLDYMRTARAKGLAESAIVIRHALKNAAIPLVTIIALDIPELFIGALVTEQIFGWPGIGRLFWDAATRTDYPILMAVLAVSSALVILGNLIADVAYGYLDPRIRYA
ncbi:MAG: ABC transporter permease [Chloroflexota bacterium]|nr:ABC transporter permease [Chloroflexota bacterium]MDE3193398.1 ABC transporter permease [Chloroflexota bacterium]